VGDPGDVGAEGANIELQLRESREWGIGSHERLTSKVWKSVIEEKVRGIRSSLQSLMSLKSLPSNRVFSTTYANLFLGVDGTHGPLGRMVPIGARWLVVRRTCLTSGDF
jgi:hypothetical protein